MLDLEDQARVRGLRLLRLDTRSDLVEARTLYAALGYVEGPAFNAGQYAEHWFAEQLRTPAGRRASPSPYRASGSRRPARPIDDRGSGRGCRVGPRPAVRPSGPLVLDTGRCTETGTRAGLDPLQRTQPPGIAHQTRHRPPATVATYVRAHQARPATPPRASVAEGPRRYAEAVTAEAHAAEPRLPARTPAGVRGALPDSDRVEFERAYRAALLRASTDFDLRPVHDLIEQWWRVAVLSSDPAAHQRMLTAVASLRSGEPVASTPWRQIRDELDA